MEKVVILGNGPSMRGFDFNKLNVDTIGMNAAYRYWDKIDWYPTYYCCLDTQLIITHHKQIYRLLEQNKVKKILVRANFLKYYPELNNDNRVLIFEQISTCERSNMHQLKYKPSKFFMTTVNNVVTTGGYAIRFALHLGYKSIYLLGIDCQYIELLPESKKLHVEPRNVKLVLNKTPTNNPNYFFDDYQREGDMYHQPNPEHNKNMHLDVFKILKKDIVKFSFNCNIINCNKKSLLFEQNIFPYKDIEQIL